MQCMKNSQVEWSGRTGDSGIKRTIILVGTVYRWEAHTYNPWIMNSWISPSSLSWWWRPRRTTKCPPLKNVISTEWGELRFRANMSFCHSLVFLRVICRGCYTPTSYVSLYAFMCGSSDSSLQGRLRAALLHKVGREVKPWAQRSGLSPDRTAAITLNHPPSFLPLLSLWPPLTSTDLENIWRVQATKSGAGLCFACKQQKYWANYKIIIWW